VPIRDLTYRRRQGFLQRFPLPAQFPCVSMHSSTTSKASFLYLTAAYVRRRYSQASDGLVACCDAEVPGCVAVRFRPEQDHCDCVFPRRVDAEMLAEHRAECAAAVEQWDRVADAATEEARRLKNGGGGGGGGGSREAENVNGANGAADAGASGDALFQSADDDGEAAVAAAAAMASDEVVYAPVANPVPPAPKPELVPVSIARLKHRAKLRERMPMPPAIGPVLVRAYAAWWGGGIGSSGVCFVVCFVMCFVSMVT
jgi:hypothetical protein